MMPAVWIVVAAFAVACIVAWAVMRRSAAAASNAKYPEGAGERVPPVEVTRNQPSKRNKLYYGVSVVPGVNACEAVDALRGARYLTYEAPSLPLPDCDVAKCTCKMMPEDDRRSGFDRRRDSFSAYGDYTGLRHKRRSEGPDRRKK